MEETEVNPLLKAFQEQKVSKLNTELLEAQKLVNLYRSLHCFPAEFSERYNQLLLASTDEQRRLLTTLMGGGEVRSYFDFLQQTVLHNQEDNNANSLKGYLPSPEMDQTSAISGDGESVVVSKEEWQSMKEQQKMLLEQTQKLMQALKNNNSELNPIKQAPQAEQNYSEIIEDEG